MKPTRKTSPRWMESRLRRLAYKIEHESAWGPNGFREIPMQELERCRVRARQLKRALVS
jgi:hypothetical protein